MASSSGILSVTPAAELVTFLDTCDVVPYGGFAQLLHNAHYVSPFSISQAKSPAALPAEIPEVIGQVLISKAKAFEARAEGEHQAGSRGSAVDAMLAKLKRCGISRCPDHIRSKMIMNYPRQLELAAFSASDDDALSLYTSVKEQPATSTRCGVLQQANVAINGPLSSALNLLSAAHSVTGEPFVLKILLKSDIWSRKSSDCEERAYTMLRLHALPNNVAIVPHKLVDVELKMTKAGHGDFRALLMTRYVMTINELPPGLSLTCMTKQGRRILRALQYMHTNGLVHEDVKGANVFVDERGNWRLGDMGSSTVEGEAVTSATEMWYPERIVNQLAHPYHDFGLLATMLATLCLKNEAPEGEEAQLASLRTDESGVHISGQVVVDVLRRAKGVGPLDGQAGQEADFKTFISELLGLCDQNHYPAY